MKRSLITLLLTIVVVFVVGTTGYVILRRGGARSLQDKTIHDVEYSLLETDPKRYLGKTVRVRALVFGGPLDDPRLVNERVPPTGVSIGYDFAPDAKEASAKLDEAFGPKVWIPHKVERCERALATVIGQFIEDPTRTKVQSACWQSTQL